jgi:hypothetical protein
MAALNAYLLVPDGTPPTYAAAAAGGDTAPVGSHLFLHIKNGGGSPITATLAVPGNTWNGIATPDTPFVISNGAERMIPLDSRYQQSDGRAAITYTAVTSVTVAVVATF